MLNPFFKIRNEAGLSTFEFAMVTGVSYQTINRIEKGHAQKISETLLDKMEEWGYNRHELLKEYENYVQHLIQQLEAKMTVPSAD